jgi:sulfite reductase beta subunit-like hemoprotein
LLSVVQAATLSRLGREYGSGTLHLTTRGSIEFHDLEYAQLPLVQRGMAAVGLFSRGACGGAVRGISTSTGFGRGFNFTQVLGRKLLLHFSGNPHFEGLPKKFKIAVEADYVGSRHLIQDLAFVYVDQEAGRAFYDIWAGGGLGRAPQAAILYRQRVTEGELLPLAEAVVRVYRANVEPPKRLKSLIGSRGEVEFRRLVDEELARNEPVQFRDAFDKTLLPVSGDLTALKLVVPIFAGELSAEKFGKLVAAAAASGVDYLLVTADQNLALLPADQQMRRQLVEALGQAGFSGFGQPFSVLRVCPGSHECRMGLAATRDLATSIQQRFGSRLSGRSLAVSGCANSCAQPQLAEFGISACKSVKGEDGQRTPRFDLYRRDGNDFGVRVAMGVTTAELFAVLDAEL